MERNATDQGRPAKRPRESPCPPGPREPTPKPPEAHPPPNQSTERHPRNERKGDHFGSLAREFQSLDENNPVLAAQATRLVNMYKRLWESYVSKSAANLGLETENWHLKQFNRRLSEENREAREQTADQGMVMSSIKRAFHAFAEEITALLDSEER